MSPYKSGDEVHDIILKKMRKKEKREKKREGAMLLSLYHTCASK
jgi:hypothetical protein